MNKAKVIKDNLKALHNYRKRRVALDNPPTFVWIEPTNHCNLNCIMCPNGAGKVNIEKGYMDLALYKKLVDQVRGYASVIVLALGGEPLCHPDIFRMVEYAVENGIKTALNTNATLLDERASRALLDAGLSTVSFAFDGFNKETYEKARLGANFEETLANIRRFLELKKRLKKHTPYTVLSILELGIEGCGEAERRAFLRSFDGAIDEIRLREPSSWGSTFKDCEKFSHKTFDVLWAPCSRLWTSVCVAYNGEVLPCVYNMNHEYVAGDVNRERLLDIWNGRALTRLRQAMVDGSYLDISPICENCIVLGIPPVAGIPSGIRTTLADAAVNIFGYKFERFAIRSANKLSKVNITSKTIK